MKILVALEPNPSSSSPVFEVALRQIQNKKVDSLFLLSVTETHSANPVIPFGSIFSTRRSSTHPESDSNRREGEEDPQKYDPKGEYVNTLTFFANRCQDLGIEHHVILGVAEHVGTLICQAVVEKGIDLVVLGRRKFGTFERLFAGSTSKYCIENAICNVLVVKDQTPSEVHGDVREVIAASERERERQIKHDEVIEVHSDLNKVRQAEEEERQRRIKEEMGGTPEDQAKKEKFDHELARNITRMAEEEERQRRMKEEEALDKREKLEREAAWHVVVSAEEKERARRIEEEKELDKREELQRMINQKAADRLEEEERERRLTEEVPSFIDRRLQVELLGKRAQA